MKIKIILVCLFLTPLHAHSAEMADWYKLAIKSPNPNELAYYAGVDEDCLADKSIISNTIEGVLIRSRVKPSVAFYENNRTYLSVTLNCLEPENGKHIFTLSIHFGKLNPKPSILFDKSYGFFGAGGKEFIIQNLKISTEQAVTDYLKANFDL
jgi:hypothetical protein